MLLICYMNTINLVNKYYQIGNLHHDFSSATMVAERRKKMQDILYFFKNYKKELILGALVCISVLLSCYSIYENNQKEEVTEDQTLLAQEEPEKDEEEPPSIVHVDIKGAVAAPGVYHVEERGSMNDVISLAGGFKEDAYQEGINLSKKVSDEMVIYVYSQKEIKTNETKTESTKPNSSKPTNTCNATSYDINDCVEKTESVIITSENTEDSSDQEENNTSKLVNINTASIEELTSLSGIGDAKAKAIIEYRKTNGNFKTIEDILNVNGIGDAIFTKIKDYITI